MPEEKSIFSKLKPINMNEEKLQNTSSFKSQELQSKPLSQSDLSLKDEIMILKEKISLIEKTVSEISKNLQSSPSLPQIKNEMISDIKNIVSEEILKTLSNLNKEVNQIIVNSIDSIRSEFIKKLEEEKIFSTEKFVSELSKQLQSSILPKIKTEILSNAKDIVRQEILNAISNLGIEQTVKNSINSFRTEVIKIVKEEVNNSVAKNVQLIEGLKDLSLKDYEKIEDISVKMANIMRIFEKVESFENMTASLRNDMIDGFKMITQEIQKISIKFESEILEQLFKGLEKTIYHKLYEINDTILKKFDMLENGLKEDLRENNKYISNELDFLLRKIDDFRKSMDYISNIKEKISQSQIEAIKIELKNIEATFKELKNKLFGDDELKNMIAIKKYSAMLIEIESKIASLEDILTSLIKSFK